MHGGSDPVQTTMNSQSLFAPVHILGTCVSELALEHSSYANIRIHSSEAEAIEWLQSL